MDTSDLSLEQFLVRELQCTNLSESTPSLEDMKRQQKKLGQQNASTHGISEEERQDALNVKLTPENFSYILLRLDTEVSYEVAKETVRRFYREAGYTIVADYTPGNRLLLEARLDTDVVQVSCKIEEGNILSIFTV